jgi:hypothetical protein
VNIRLRATRGQDEVNARGASYKVNKWGCVSVPAEDVPPLLKVGGFAIASEDTEGVDTSTLADVAEVCWHLPLGRTRSTLLALCENTNQRNYLIDAARSNIAII